MSEAKGKLYIRRALPEEARLLSDLALRSKAHWGYRKEFLEACRAELTLSYEYIASSPVFVLEEEGEGIIGFYGLRQGLEEGEAELLYLFLEPSVIKRGYGRRLWEHLVETASRLGFRRILIESDPYAEPFYQAMGARRVGTVMSTVSPDRRLPLLHFP